MRRFREYVVDGDMTLLVAVERDSEFSKIANIPLSQLEGKYRNLIESPDMLGEENYEDFSSYSLMQIMTWHMGYDDETCDDYEYHPYFVRTDDTDEICGFISFPVNPTDNSVENIVLFSFNINKKDYGRQILIDFEKLLHKYHNEGYDITWDCLKTNHVVRYYDRIISDFDSGERSEYNRYIYLYSIPSDEDY